MVDQNWCHTSRFGDKMHHFGDKMVHFAPFSGYLALDQRVDFTSKWWKTHQFGGFITKLWHFPPPFFGAWPKRGWKTTKMGVKPHILRYFTTFGTSLGQGPKNGQHGGWDSPPGGW